MSSDIEYVPMHKKEAQEIKTESDEAPPSALRSPGSRFQNFMHVGNMLQSFIGSSILTLPYYNMMVV
jgi:hypothetical protein